MKNIYLHIGDLRILKTKDIVGVFDMDTATVMKSTRNFLEKCQNDNKIDANIYDIPRSFTVCTDMVYLSSINTASVKRRSEKSKIF